MDGKIEPISTDVGAILPSSWKFQMLQGLVLSMKLFTLIQQGTMLSSTTKTPLFVPSNSSLGSSNKVDALNQDEVTDDKEGGGAEEDRGKRLTRRPRRTLPNSYVCPSLSCRTFSNSRGRMNP